MLKSSLITRFLFLLKTHFLSNVVYTELNGILEHVVHDLQLKNIYKLIAINITTRNVLNFIITMTRVLHNCLITNKHKLVTIVGAF